MDFIELITNPNIPSPVRVATLTMLILGIGCVVLFCLWDKAKHDVKQLLLEKAKQLQATHDRTGSEDNG